MNKYWIGGPGAWNDGDIIFPFEKDHWSNSSGGPRSTAVPTINDDVIFDANSGFTADGQAVIFSGGLGGNLANSIDFSACPFAPAVRGTTDVHLHSFLTFREGMTYVVNHPDTAPILFEGTGAMELTSAGVLITQPVVVNSNGGGLTLLDDLSQGGDSGGFNQGELRILRGSFDANGFNISAYNITIFAQISADVNMGSGTITNGGVSVDDDGTGTITLNFADATWLFKNDWVSGGYNVGILSVPAIDLLFGPTTVILSKSESTFDLTPFTGDIADNWNTEFASLDFFGNDLGTFTQIAFPAGKTVGVDGVFNANGNEGHIIKFTAVPFSSDPAFLSATPTLSYIRPHNIFAQGSIPFDDTLGGEDGGGNTNWLFPGSPLPAFTPSIISAVARVEQGLAAPSFVIGGLNEDGDYALFKKGTGSIFSLWRSDRYRYDNPALVEEILLSLDRDLSGGMNIMPVLVFDDDSRRVAGTLINNTNYPEGETFIKMGPGNFNYDTHFEGDFYLELQSLGPELVCVKLPIYIDVDTDENP